MASPALLVVSMQIQTKNGIHVTRVVLPLYLFVLIHLYQFFCNRLHFLLCLTSQAWVPFDDVVDKTVWRPAIVVGSCSSDGDLRRSTSRRSRPSSHPPFTVVIALVFSWFDARRDGIKFTFLIRIKCFEIKLFYFLIWYEIIFRSSSNLNDTACPDPCHPPTCSLSML